MSPKSVICFEQCGHKYRLEITGCVLQDEAHIYGTHYVHINHTKNTNSKGMAKSD